MRRLVYILGQLWSLIYTYALEKKLKNMRMYFYSGWNHARFRSIGKGVKIFGPVQIVGNGIHLGNNVDIREHTVIATHANAEHNDPQLFIGDGTLIGEYNHITCSNGITIGKNVLFGRRVTVSDNSHGNTDVESLQIPPLKRPITSKGTITIEDNVWIGDNAVILQGVHIKMGGGNRGFCCRFVRCAS